MKNVFDYDQLQPNDIPPPVDTIESLQQFHLKGLRKLEAEKAARKAAETLALPAPRLALPERAEAFDIESAYLDATASEDITTEAPATHQDELTLCD